MPRVGLEPTWFFNHKILSLARIPISPPRQMFFYFTIFFSKNNLRRGRSRSQVSRSLQVGTPSDTKNLRPRLVVAERHTAAFDSRRKQSSLLTSTPKKSILDFLEAWTRIELVYKGFANHCLTTWLPRLIYSLRS